MNKTRATYIDSFGDEHGELGRLGRKGSRYFIEKIGAAYGFDAGKTYRHYYKTKKEAERAYEDMYNYYN